METSKAAQTNNKFKTSFRDTMNCFSVNLCDLQYQIKRLENDLFFYQNDFRLNAGVRIEINQCKQEIERIIMSIQEGSYYYT